MDVFLVIIFLFLQYENTTVACTSQVIRRKRRGYINICEYIQHIWTYATYIKSYENFQKQGHWKITGIKMNGSIYKNKCKELKTTILMQKLNIPQRLEKLKKEEC